MIDLTEDAEHYFAENPSREKVAIARALREMDVDYEWDEEGDVVADVGDERFDEFLYHFGEVQKSMVLKDIFERGVAAGALVEVGIDDEGLVKYGPGPNIDTWVDED